MNEKGMRELVIDLNTGKPGRTLPTSQLWHGINSKGIRLEDIGGAYSPATIEGIPGVFKGKREKGLPFDRVTLYDSGEFYESFEVRTEATGDDLFIVIEADTNIHGADLDSDWGRDIVGLTDENIDIFSRKFVEMVKKEINDAFA